MKGYTISNGGLVFKFGPTDHAIALFEVWLWEENLPLKNFISENCPTRKGLIPEIDNP